MLKLLQGLLAARLTARLVFLAPIVDVCKLLLPRPPQPPQPPQPLEDTAATTEGFSSFGWSRVAIRLDFWPWRVNTLASMFLTSWWSASPSMMRSSANIGRGDGWRKCWSPGCKGKPPAWWPEAQRATWHRGTPSWTAGQYSGSLLAGEPPAIWSWAVYVGRKLYKVRRSIKVYEIPLHLGCLDNAGVTTVKILTGGLWGLDWIYFTSISGAFYTILFADLLLNHANYKLIQGLYSYLVVIFRLFWDILDFILQN